ncbi:MAG: aKG-HExxH-type peptide beta-hydroxylase [Candidatus Binataceae bacterium]
MPQQAVRVLDADRIDLGEIDPAAFETVVFPTGEVGALDSLTAAFADSLARRVRTHAGERHWIRNITSERLRRDPSWACQLVLALDEGREPPSPPSSVGANQQTIAWMRPIDSLYTPALNGPDPPAAGEAPLTPAEAAAAFTAARDLLERVWPEALREILYMVRGLRAARAKPGRQSSGSSAACPFVIRLSFDPGAPPMVLADALIHECAHLKLRLAMGLTRFCDGGGPSVYRHPWRQEDRPLEALMVATHAFVAIHHFYLRLVRQIPSAGASANETRLRDEVAQAVAALSAAENRLPPAGRALVLRSRAIFMIGGNRR